MAGLKQSKRRVSWPKDHNLCKVRLFLSDDTPSQSGLVGGQDHLQAKAAWLLHAGGFVDNSDDCLPPGFELAKKFFPKIEISQIPLKDWQCPPKLVLNPEWLVVAGDESEEVSIETHRQLGVLEAVYPRPSSIPPNPLIAPEVQVAHVDDSCTPHIPVISIEDEDRGEEQFDTVTPPNTEKLIQQSKVVPSVPNKHSPLASATAAGEPTPSVVEPDVLAAASAAFTAIMRSSEEGSLIDRDLLIKILSNADMLEKLVSEYGTPKQSYAQPQQSFTASQPQQSPTAPQPTSPAITAPLSASPTLHVFHLPNVASFSSQTLHQAPLPVPACPPVKDINYYKSLIQMHGGEKKEGNLGSSFNYQNSMTRVSTIKEPKAKVVRRCAYFNTPTGCRHGASCLFQHNASGPQQFEQQKGATKRIKLDKGIPGRD